MKTGNNHRPYMIHRALLGSMERFFAVLIEHHAGNFPVWLTPVQAVVLPIADRHHEYAQKVVEQLKAAGLRTELDASSSTLNYRIREAQNAKIPFMIVLGDKEAEAGGVSVRLRNGEEFADKTTAGFLKFAAEKIAARVAI